MIGAYGAAWVPVTLIATGQTISYAAGDDGALRTGAALSYTDHGDGTVTDNSTGLMWEKKTDANVDVNFTWQGALAYVAELNAMNGGAGFAGHNDWRLPNIRELLSTVDYGRSNPPINPAFGPTRGISNYSAYWSSTTWAGSQPGGSAWAVEFAGHLHQSDRRADLRPHQRASCARGSWRAVRRLQAPGFRSPEPEAGSPL